MSKDKISDYSSTANSNTDIAAINIDEGCAPSGINNAIRALMAQLKNWQSGAQDVYITPAGSVSAPAVTTNGDTNTGIYFPAADKIALATGGIQAVIVDASQNVGIGTSSPATNFQIDKATQNVVRLTSGSAATDLIATASGDGQLRTVGAHPLIFGTNATERMRIDSSGNLGIGTSSPQARLHSYTNDAVPAYLQANASSVYLRFGNNNSTNGYIGYEGAGGTNMTFWTNNTQRASIDSSGNLLVGTTSVSAYGKVSVAFNGSAYNGASYNDTNNTTGAGFIYFLVGGTTIGSITRVGSGSTISYATSSDYRLKENISPMTGALDIVQRLKPVTYTWKADGSDGQGFIAHELAEVCPDAVVGEKDAVNEDGSIKSQGIDTSFLVATLTAAIQEQQAMIASQSELITTLTERITALEQA